MNVRVLSEWIKSCDQTHNCLPKADSLLPTRVLDVGAEGTDHIRLVGFVRGATRPGKYLALSHRWGDPKQHREFCTLTTNIEDHKKGIMIAKMPKTFRDAVKITRRLGVQYLWIDSLCIIQNNDDWEHESHLMEQVYSSAYATIAATCSSGTEDGFIKPRPDRQCVMMGEGNSAYYVCEAIDDFYEDVDQAELNTRGWVLQERALSRRTIHFTERQCYWECGGGVRCETLTIMKKY